MPADRRAAGVARVGCSGWVYRHWRGSVYPEDLPQRRWAPPGAVEDARRLKGLLGRVHQ